MISLFCHHFRNFLDAVHLRQTLLRALCTLREKELLGMAAGAYLQRMGWFRSLDEQACVNGAGEPIPWMTFPFVEFISPRLSDSHAVFEYGSGASTKFFASHVKSVSSVEHDSDWFAKVSQSIPDNAAITFSPLDDTDTYEKSCLSKSCKFDIIIIDGRRRCACIEYALQTLADSGVIILDNSDLLDYAAGIRKLQSEGFRELPFWGPAAFTTGTNCTSVFYRPKNCLLI